MSRTRPRDALRALALALPAALLAVGWFAASLRAERARTTAARRDLSAAAAVVAAAAREGLEELRAREDERPYYLYSYYYTPPELIAAQESVAASPLGRVPADPRVRGHFQLDPGPRITSPLEHPEAPATARARATEVLAALSGPVATRLAELTRPPTHMQAAVLSNAVQGQHEYYGSVLADLRAAEAGERAAQERAAGRGRAPLRPRVDRSWAQLFRGASPRSADALEDSVVAEEPPATAPSAPAAFVAPAPRQGERALYTPMVFRRDGAMLLLVRVVETDGAASVQGALLDAAELRGRWLAAVAQRHAAPAVRVVFAPAGAACDARAALPYPLEALAVCAQPRGAPAGSPLYLQFAALGVALALIAATAAARARALSRAEALAGVERAFVASVSHQLRTPLTTLRMHAEMLREGWVSEARRDRVLAQLVDESARLARLVEDVLTFGRLADGRAELRPVAGDLAAAAREIAERERARLAERGVRIDTTALTAPVPARFDPSALEQALLNVLDNAAKYAGSASGAAVELAAEQRLARAVLRVRDHGPGIPRSERGRVFERFYRSPDAVGSHVAGTGLGLAIVRGLCRAMGGDARVADVHGAGCAIELDLPAAAAPHPLQETPQDHNNTV